jgi:hypothetical protein
MRDSSSGPMSKPWRAPGGLFAEDVPERGRARAPDRLGQAMLGQAGLELVRGLAGLGNAGQVTFDVGHEHRHAQPREALGQRLQRDGLAGAGGAGDQAVAVAHFGQQHSSWSAFLAMRMGSAMSREAE